jgi:hypothetical protein
MVGIAASEQGTLYSLSTFAASSDGCSLFTIDANSGGTQLVGSTGLLDIFEGDLDFDPMTGVLYGVQNVRSDDVRELFSIDTNTGVATPIGSISPAGDYSAMAFDAAGTLYVLDTRNELLMTVDPSDAAILSTLSLSAALGQAAGMDFHPDTGVLYVADGAGQGTNNLYTLDTTTGVLTTIGPTGLADGLAGLEFVPEPGTLCLLALGTLMAARRRSR